jgi:HlyD family secretion protein
MKYRLRIFVLSVLPCVLYVCLLGCSGKDSSDQTENRKKIPVKIHTVGKGKINSYLDVTGSTLPLEKAKMGSKVEGTITEILVDEGDIIKKGQILFRLDSKDFLLDIERAKGALAFAQAEREKAEHDLEQKENDWKRLSALVERRVIAKHQYDSMKASFSMAQAAAKACESQIQQRKAEMDLAEKRYQDSVVKAPFDGVVTKKMLNEGEISSLWAYNWEVLEVMDLSKIKIESDISEKHKSQIREGMEANIKVDALPGRKFTGIISIVNPMVDPKERTFRVKIVIPNPERLLTAGMFARIRLLVEEKEGVITIPVRDVLERSDGHFVFVVKNGVAEQRKISVGISNGDWIEVTGGLNAGEIIVIEGSHRLQEGSSVESVS